VVRSLILETTFLIDLEREESKGVAGPAVSFLEAHESARMYLTFTAAGELAAGLSLGDRELWDAVAYRMPVVTRNIEPFSRVPGVQVKTY